MATLLGTNGQKLTLEPNRTYTIGRGSDCDVTLQDGAASRCHAKLITGSEPGALLIEDCGSTNGTFIDEEKIAGRRPLIGLTRIRIGASTFLVHPDDTPTATDPQLDTGTIGLEALTLGKSVNANVLRVAADHDTGSTEIAGQLSSFTCIDVFQLLIQTHRTGTLHLTTDAGDSSVYLQDGEFLHAVHGDLEGFPALAALVELREGIFWFVESMPDVRRTVNDSSSIVLFELCRTMDNAGV